MTLEASNPQEAIKILSQLLTENSLQLDPIEAKKLALNAFDIIITTSKDELGRRKISTISEINLTDENDYIKDLFNTNYAQLHQSLGYTPLFYKDIKENSLPISDNIFSQEYKHTYNKNLSTDSQYLKKNTNIDILKKFKK